MRVHVPSDEADTPRAYVGRTYACEITGAAGAFAQSTYQHTKLSLREFEAARARTAEINGCQLCQSWRSAHDVPAFLTAMGGAPQSSVASHGPAPDEAYYLAVTDWRTSPIYSERERLAIEYAERFGTGPQSLAMDDEFWTRFKGAFSDDEIVDLSYCVASWTGLGRVSHVLGLDDACLIPRVAAERTAAGAA